MITSRTRSIWANAGVSVPRFPSVTMDMRERYDVVVIGAGITGLTCASLLKQRGQRVAVVDAGPFGEHGMTYRTTAHITHIEDMDFNVISTNFGRDIAKRVLDHMSLAADTIETLPKQFGFTNDFVRCPAYRWAETPAQRKMLEKEFQSLQSLGLPCQYPVDAAIPGLPVAPLAVARYENQALFHPMQHLIGLARYVHGDGSAVYQESFVNDYSESKKSSHPHTQQQQQYPCEVKTTSGGVLECRKIIMATHTPVGVWATIQSRMLPINSYVMAVRLASPLGSAIYDDMDEPYHYIRPFRSAGDNIAIVGGCDHKAGEIEDTEQPFAQLERWTRERFPVQEVLARWSGMLFEPVDGLPFVGLGPGCSHTYIATGLSGCGMLLGTMSAQLLSDLVLDIPHPLADALSPSRVRSMMSLSSLSDVAQEGWTNVKALLLRRLTSLIPLRSLRGEPNPRELPPSTGAIVSRRGQKVAVYKDAQGELRSFSATCTHTGCIVSWNQSEQRFDCPCHGSCYKAEDGTVISGPTTKPLCRMDIPW